MVNSIKKFFLGTKKILGIIAIGPQDIQQIAIKIPAIVENSLTQNDAKPLAHSFLSPRVNLPY